ncbi:hypothetical protein [Thermococcus aciditolerans]|nr:hypothetical protein [Thermococcus aciditolerans]
MAEEAGEKPRITVIAYSRDKFLSRKAESIEEALSLTSSPPWLRVPAS